MKWLVYLSKDANFIFNEVPPVGTLKSPGLS